MAGQVPREKFLIAALQSAYLFYSNSYRTFRGDGQKTPLKDIVWEKELFQKVIGKHGALSKYIEAHLHSDAYVPIKPTPEMLMKEINEFDEIKKEHTALKKSAA
jgi:uncharacterized protein YozE (UPF0346 family)